VGRDQLSRPLAAVEIISHVLSDLRVENFRCIGAADFQFDPRLNVFTGGNGAGKTSILEAVYFLGRARSFRTGDSRVLIKSGGDAAQVTGTAIGSAGSIRLGVRIGIGGTDIHVSGRSGAQIAELVSALPVQAIHADIGELVEGPPDLRRRLLDWGVFHVKHDYLAQWRRFRRAHQQRNAVLRDRGGDELLEAWDQELALAATGVDQCRHEYLQQLGAAFAQLAEKIIGEKVALRYQRGWPADEDLAVILRDTRESDRAAGYTRTGPHRADLQFEISAERSRWKASKGQQKMLGAALVLAQCDQVAGQLERPVALLVDEPAADLDRPHLEQLLRAIYRTRTQIFMAAITAEGLPLTQPHSMFHVEHGSAKALL
jgi:DNA replication and repair protein RecF